MPKLHVLNSEVVLQTYVQFVLREMDKVYHLILYHYLLDVFSISTEFFTLMMAMQIE